MAVITGALVATVGNAVITSARNIIDIASNTYAFGHKLEESHYRAKMLSNDMTKTYLQTSALVGIDRNNKYKSGATDNNNMNDLSNIIHSIRNAQRDKW